MPPFSLVPLFCGYGRLSSDFQVVGGLYLIGGKAEIYCCVHLPIGEVQAGRNDLEKLDDLYVVPAR